MAHFRKPMSPLLGAVSSNEREKMGKVLLSFAINTNSGAYLSISSGHRGFRLVTHEKVHDGKVVRGQVPDYIDIVLKKA